MTDINTTQPKSPEKVKLPLEGILFIALNLALSIFVHKKWVNIIITDYCFKSQEIDFENKMANLSGYFSTQNKSIDYWAMFWKRQKRAV